ncbi:MAG: hypothetical protein ACR2N0_14175 [Rubrobacteraceae bacterium]
MVVADIVSTSGKRKIPSVLHKAAPTATRRTPAKPPFLKPIHVLSGTGANVPVNKFSGDDGG